MRGAVGTVVTPRVIPFGKDTDEQYRILDVIADAVPNGEVSFDLTHGFRHLGMVGFMSAFMLEQVRSPPRSRSLVRGARHEDPTSGVTPVLRPRRSDSRAPLARRLDQYDASGDYGVFSSLLIEDGVGRGQGCVPGAGRVLRTDVESRRRGAPDQDVPPDLDNPLAGVRRACQKPACGTSPLGHDGKSGRHQRRLAFEYLKRRDFMRGGRVRLGSARHTGMRAARTSRR